MWDRRTKPSTIVRIAAVAVCYAIIAKLGLRFEAVSGFASLVWPATGFALAMLLLLGSEMWPGILLGAWAIEVSAGASVPAAFVIAGGNTLEAVAGAFLMRRVADYRGSFDRVRHVVVLVLAVAVLTPSMSATLGVLTLRLDGIVRSMPEALETWRAWWVGDALGNLVIAPLFLSWAPRATAPKLSVARVVEAVALAALLSFQCYRLFFLLEDKTGPFGRAYTLFPLLIWAALRFEMRGATVATALASALAAWGTMRRTGPFSDDDIVSALLSLQVFIACAAVTPLVVASVLMERRRAVREREIILATVSHDLKNPLNCLLMSAELLARKLPDVEPVQRHHELLKRSVDRMMRLITDLLDASAIDRGQLNVQRNREDMRQLASEALELLRPLCPSKTLSLSGDAIEVECDRGRVLQVLSNVVGNAIKFSPDGETVHVEIARIAHAVRVSIHDHGPGIATVELRQIFDCYWHTPAVHGGSGLGLFIAKGIVEAHGGKIWAESIVGVGSSFHFTIPLRTQPITRHGWPVLLATLFRTSRPAHVDAGARPSSA